MQTIKNFFTKLDPYHQSFLYFKWNFWNIFVCVMATLWIYKNAQSAFGVTYFGEDGQWLLFNRFSYLPNYLIHEMVGHNLIGNIGWRLCYFSCQTLGQWWAASMGNGIETLVPLLALLAVLRLKGGRYLVPLVMYWLATALYEAAIYAADARAMKLHLTSSDMLSSFQPGEVFGDWHYILQPLGLLNYDVIIGQIFLLSSVICCVLAIYSLWYYWAHLEEYSLM